MEDIKILKCIRKIHVDIINEVIKVRISKEKDIGVCKCRIKG